MKDEMMDRITMTKPRLTALMRHLGLEFKESECQTCGGDGCLQDGGECPDCDHGCGVKIEVVSKLARTIPSFKSIEINNVKGRGTVITVDLACKEGKKLERLVHVRHVDPDAVDRILVDVDDKRWELTGIERSSRNSVAGLVVKEAG